MTCWVVFVRESHDEQHNYVLTLGLAVCCSITNITNTGSMHPISCAHPSTVPLSLHPFSLQRTMHGCRCWKLLIFQREKNVDLCACLISSDVSLVMLRGSESRTFTEMSSGRCWTMSESKERFEHCTTKKTLSPFNSAWFPSHPPLSLSFFSFFLS